MFTSAGNRYAAAYKTVSVETSVDSANPHNLVCLLFAALQQAIGRARWGMERGDIGVKVKQFGIAIRILEEGLKAPLDLDKGGEIGANLEDLYDYCVIRLVQGNARNDASVLDEVSRLIEPIASGWKQIGGRGPAYLKPI
jgi:flagellar protein FliS